MRSIRGFEKGQLLLSGRAKLDCEQISDTGMKAHRTRESDKRGQSPPRSTIFFSIPGSYGESQIDLQIAGLERGHGGTAPVPNREVEPSDNGEPKPGPRETVGPATATVLVADHVR